MATKSELIRQELEALVTQGKDIINHRLAMEAAKELVKRGKKDQKIVELANESDQTSSRYQKWYTKALPVVQQLLPERYREFQEYYRIDKRRNIDTVTYTISDYLSGIKVTRGGVEAFSSFGVFSSKFQCQIEILESALNRIDSILTNITAVLQAELFDDELSVANDLLKKSHLRAAGAMVGVVIERHLGQVATAHSLAMRKKDPTIADLNETLKSAGILDIPNWRFIQRLGDIRNLCVHSKDREPTKDEVEDLIRGAEKIVKTIF